MATERLLTEPKVRLLSVVGAGQLQRSMMYTLGSVELTDGNSFQQSG